MTDKPLNHAPVTSGSGSFDHVILQKELDKAVKAPAGKRDEAIAAAYEKASTIDPKDRPSTDLAAQPGFKLKEVRREIAPDVFVTETISVYDPKMADEVEAAATSAKETGAAASAPSEGSK